MLRIFFTWVLVFFAFASFASKDKPEFSFSNIPADLLQNSNIVIRKSETIMDLSSSDNIYLTEKTIVTVLNEAGMREAAINIYYNSYIKIKTLKLSLYDKSGKYLKEIDEERISDVAPNVMYNLYDDLRLKHFSFSENRFPFTFECEYKKELKSWTSLPTWEPLDMFNTSLETAYLTILVPEAKKLLFKSYSAGEPIVTKKDKSEEFLWRLSGIKAIRKINDTSPTEILFPTLFLKTDTYKMGKQTGEFETWSDVGNFYSVLNEGKTDLSPENSDAIKKIIYTKGTIKDKVKKAYQWFQSITHYISIQDGIGGFVSYDANTVFKTKYGDCKALSGFMSAVLKTIDIPSYPVLIKAGVDPGFVPTDLPGNYFNHVILCVPDEKDTIWLECTSQKQPFNFLGSFTSDRTGLLVNEKKSCLIHTPVYDESVNTVFTFSYVKLNEELLANCSLRIEMRNECQDKPRQVQYHAKNEQLEQWLNEMIDQKDVKIKSHHFLSEQKDSASTNLEMEFSSNSIATSSGTRLFIYPSLVQNYDLEEIEGERKVGYYFASPYSQVDSTVIQLPGGYHLETIFRDRILKRTEFGEFQEFLTYKKEVSQIILSRKYSVRKSFVPVNKSAEWNEYIQMIRKSLDTPIILVKD